MRDKTFAQLVQRAKAGDQQAFTSLYEATSQRVYRTIHAMVRSEELAMDIQQEVYVRAFTHLDQLEDPSRLESWLRSIAVNQTRSALRINQPVLFSELEELTEPEAAQIADESPERSPELALDRKETSRLVSRILDGLTDAQRMIVGMYYYEQMPVKQIAKALDVSTGAVKSQLHRSRAKIEAEVRLLEEQGVKLYGLTPLPFLLGLLGAEQLQAEAGRRVLAGAAERLAEAAAPTGLQVGRRFLETGLGKAVLALMAAGVIGGGAAGWNWAAERAQPSYGDVQPTHEVQLEHRPEPGPTLPEGTEAVPEASEQRLTEPAPSAPEATAEVTPSSEPAQDSPAPAPQPSQPAASAPAESSPGKEWTAPIPTAPDPVPYPVGEDPEVVDWGFTGAAQRFTVPEALQQGTQPQLEFNVRGVFQMMGLNQPSIRSSDENVVRISRFSHMGPNGSPGQTCFRYTLIPAGPGSCTLTFSYAGTPDITILLTVEEHNHAESGPTAQEPADPVPTEQALPAEPVSPEPEETAAT